MEPLKSDFINNLIGLDQKGFFIFKKTEKIVSAIHLVTAHIKDNETLKWQMRSSGIGLLSIVTTFVIVRNSDVQNTAVEIKLSCLEIFSLLDIARVTGLISHNNVSLLKQELEQMLGTVLGGEEFVGLVHNQNGTGVISKSFFDFNTTTGMQVSPVSFSGNPSLSKGHVSDMSNSTSVPKHPVNKDKKPLNMSAVHSTRRSSILSIIKDKKDISVADIASAIKDCGEKTLQRELLRLVKEGVLKKEGERRWSRYRLA